MQNNSIAIFDSGFGGLTVMRAIMELMPEENLIYLGDTARIPYGNKSKETIIRYSIENSSFLLQQNIKMLVVACHTCSSQALDILENALPIPVIGITKAAADEIAGLKEKSHVAILGTQGTISSEFYQEQIQERFENMKFDATACPLFVPLVEEGLIHHPATWLLAKEYLSKYEDKDIDAVLLACTHYPLLKEVLQMLFKETVQFIDPAFACAKKVQEFLKQTNQEAVNSSPSYRFLVSDSPEKFRTFGPMFLKRPIPDVELIANYIQNIVGTF